MYGLISVLSLAEIQHLPRWALAALVALVALGGVRLLQGTAAGASLNARLYAVAHFFAQARL